MIIQSNPPATSRKMLARRSFLSGLAVTVPVAAIATKSRADAPANQKLSINIDNASPELRAAAQQLGDALDRLEAARAAADEGMALASAWRDLNPPPTANRARKRWTRKYLDYRDTVVDAAWGKQLDAERDFREAQLQAARVKVSDVEQMVLKAALAANYDKTSMATGQRAYISYALSVDVVAVMVVGQS